jgi:hypothetical protein
VLVLVRPRPRVLRHSLFEKHSTEADDAMMMMMMMMLVSVSVSISIGAAAIVR